MHTHPSTVRTASLTGLTLVAFAANSLLTRMALGDRTIDAASFATLRLSSGAVMLWLILRGRESSLSSGPKAVKTPVTWTAAVMLFLYAVTFSFSYLQLTTGTGALILFGTVQVTMIAAALYQGEKPRSLEWLGLVLALGGLVYLVSPGLAAPPVLGGNADGGGRSSLGSLFVIGPRQP